MRRGLRPLVVVAGAVVIASCSTDTTTSSGTLTPTTLPAGATTTLLGSTTTAPSGAVTTTPTTTTSTSTSTTTTTTVAASATTTPPAASADVAAAFIGGPDDEFWLPLGYWSGTAWVQLGEEGESTPLEFAAAAGDPLQVTGLDLAPATAALGGAGEACFDERIGFAVDVAAPEPDPPGFGYSGIGVVGGWPIQPRPANQVGLQIDEYRQIGATFADDLGVDGTTGKVVQVVRSDLDGDGMEEVLVVFEHFESPFGAPGDLALVYLRAPQTSGQVVDTVIFSSFVAPDLPEDQLPFLNRARVLGVADLNGDGRMEVALRTWYHEGAGVTAFEFDGDGATAVMGNGCGA